MNMKKRATDIYHMHVDDAMKIKLLNDLLVDCYNEMEAQDQNMHPEVKHNLAEGFRVAKDYLRKLTTD